MSKRNAKRLTNDLVSVIIPCYNNKATLERAINAALNQKNILVELIIVDDASTEDIVSIIEKFNDARIKFIQLTKNSGPANARNIGLDTSEGKWIQFLDADDIISKNKIIKQLANAGDADIVVSDWIEKDLNQNRSILRKNRLKSGEANIYHFIEDNPILMHTAIVKHSFIMKTGGFHTDIFHEDWEFWIRVASMRPLIKYVPGFYATYVRHNKSKSYNRISNYQNRINCLQYVSKRSYIKPYNLKEKIDKSIRNIQIRLAVEHAKLGKATSTEEIMTSLLPPPSLIEKLEVRSASLPFSSFFHGKLPGPKKLKRFFGKLLNRQPYQS